MNQKPAVEQIDERLTTLLQIEQRLEAQLKQAEFDGRAQVAAARVALDRARADGLLAVEALAAEELRVDTAAHEASLGVIEVERRAALEALSTPTAQHLERLARKALARAIGGAS